MSVIESSPAKFDPESVIPTVESTVFFTQPDAHFWLGRVASGSDVALPNEYRAAGALRANVYIDECGYLDESARLTDGTERDINDARSTHFAVMENNIALKGAHRLVGTTRLIRKHTETDDLPIEELFPEAFRSEKSPVMSVEASRFIARHPNRLLQNMVSLSLIRAMVLEAEEKSSPYIYAVVEDHLTKLFHKIGLPLTQLAEAKPIAEYDNTINMPLRFSPSEILETANADSIGQYKMSPFFWGADQTRGLGHYDISLTNQPEQAAA